MKDLRPALRTLLLSDGAISTLVGGNRIYPGIVPQGETRPTIVQNLISEASDFTMDGRSGLGAARVQIDCWSLLQDSASSLANLVFDVLVGYRGVVSFGSSSPQDQIDIRGILLANGHDEYDSVSKMFTRRRDYQVWYSET